MSLALSLRDFFNAQTDNDSLMNRYALTGDEKLLGKLVDNCGHALYHYLLVMTDAELAKDICQKTWLKIIEKRHLYHSNGRFEAWLFTLARNALLDEFRRQQRFVDNPFDEPTALESNGDIDNTALSDAFQRALGKLPFEQRDAFCLQQEGFGLQEIANMCNANPETIKSRLRYARQGLKKSLEQYHGE